MNKKKKKIIRTRVIINKRTKWRNVCLPSKFSPGVEKKWEVEEKRKEPTELRKTSPLTLKEGGRE